MTPLPLRLYVDPMATSCRPVVATTYALNLEIERIDLSLMRGEHMSPAFRAVNPAGKVPVLVSGDFTLTESAAIARYLCDRLGSPLGGRGGLGRARVDEAIHWLSSTISVHFCQGLVYPRILPFFRWDDPVVQTATEERAQAGAEAALDHLQRVLQIQPCIAGDEVTIADFFGVGMLSLGRVIGYSFEEWPGISSWMARVGATPAWKRLDRELGALPVQMMER